MRKNNPLEPESFIARTPGEIIEASKSKYCPVAANVALKEILREKGVFYAVGLPCHIHGIRKAQSVIKDLRKKIVLTFGLLCSHTVDFAGTSLLLQKMRFKESDIASIRYRGEGWPGFMTIKTKSGVSKKIPLFRSWNAYWPLFSSFFFTPMRCTMCPDQTAELADISFGDAWLPEFKKEKKGMSIVVTRTNAGEALIKHAESAKKISLTPAVIEKVVESQRVNLKFKKNDLNSRLSFLKLMGKATPSFTPSFPDSASIACTMRTAYIYSGIRASSNKTFRSILANAPLPLVRSYYGVYKYLSIV
jgi:coenzyme F420 hydrogenase subunit beta